MDKRFLMAFCRYYHAVQLESHKMSKISKHFINNPQLELLNYHVFIQNQNSVYPSQTDLIYDLEMDVQQLRPLLKTSIEIGYIITYDDVMDRRITRYKTTNAVHSGLEIHVARHTKSMLAMGLEMEAIPKDVEGLLQLELEKVLGKKHMVYPAYGANDISVIKDILKEMNVNE